MLIKIGYDLTFNVPVEVPKATLPPGRYLFAMVAPNVLRVMSPDRKKTYAMFLTRASTRSVRFGDEDYQQIKFDRGAGNGPVRLVGIYPEGSVNGIAPMYGKRQRAAANLVASRLRASSDARRAASGA